MGDALEISANIFGTSLEMLNLKMDTKMAATLVERIDLLASSVGTNFKTSTDAIAGISSQMGSLSALTTTQKATLVGALNELKADYASINMTDLIDDTLKTDNMTWSSAKIDQVISAAIAGVIGAAPDALNALDEFAAALKNDPNIINGLEARLAKTVRFDEAQLLSPVERATVIGNIGAVAISDFNDLQNQFNLFKGLVGDVDNADFVATMNAAKIA